MALRNIIEDGDEVLTKKCRPVTKFDRRLHILLDDMAETMHHANGVGLAAPQVGILRRVAVIDVSPEQNKVIELVKRPNYVKVRAQDRHGEEFEIEGKELLARAFCHEIDHLNGVVFKDVCDRMLTKKEIEEMNKS